MEESNTLQKILEAGKAEFLEKGFKSASLRNIVKTAGVTTGAFYGYFSGKEASQYGMGSLPYDSKRYVYRYFRAYTARYEKRECP